MSASKTLQRSFNFGFLTWKTNIHWRFFFWIPYISWLKVSRFLELGYHTLGCPTFAFSCYIYSKGQVVFYCDRRFRATVSAKKSINGKWSKRSKCLQSGILRVVILNNFNPLMSYSPRNRMWRSSWGTNKWSWRGTGMTLSCTWAFKAFHMYSTSLNEFIATMYCLVWGGGGLLGYCASLCFVLLFLGGLSKPTSVTVGYWRVVLQQLLPIMLFTI